MNSVISSVIINQSVSSTSTAGKTEVKTVKSAEVTETQTSQSGTSVTSKYDTLELSQDYIEYKTQSENSTAESDTNQLNSLASQQMPAGAPPPPPPADEEESDESDSIITESLDAETTETDTVTSDSEEETVSGDLSSYSEQELKTLLSDGSITKAEYNEEMKARQAEAANSTDSTNSINV